MANKLIDMTGQRYGRLVVLRRAAYNTNNNKPLWVCRCDCGNETVVKRRNLVNGTTKSCGCLRRELSRKMHTTHGLSKSSNKHNRLYRIWSGMKDRCLNSNSKYWGKYGSRGITVYPEWVKDYMAFHSWALSNGYNDNLTLDRINNDGNYEPENCRWVSYAVQENNRGNNVLFKVDGKTYTLAQLARKDNLSRHMAEKKYKENRIYGK